MSMDRSLKQRKNKAKSVLKRHERLAKALREEKWRAGMSIYSLPKYNPPVFKAGPKEEKEETTTTLGKTDIIQEHLDKKAKKQQEKKSKKTKKETVGRK